MPLVPTLSPNKPLTVKLQGPTAKFPMCITFPPTPGVTVSLPTAPYTKYRYSPEFQPGVCVPHPGETMTQFQARVEFVAGGAYVVLAIDAAGGIDVVAVAISDEHPYLAQSEFNYNMLEKMAKEQVEESLRLGALVIRQE